MIALQYNTKDAKKARETARIEVFEATFTQYIISHTCAVSQTRVRRTIGKMSSVMDELSTAVAPLRDLIAEPRPRTPQDHYPVQGEPAKVFSHRELAQVFRSHIEHG